MTRRTTTAAILVALLTIGTAAVTGRTALAHQCTTTTADEADSHPGQGHGQGQGQGHGYGQPDAEEPQEPEETCGPTDVYPNWRDNYVPLFDLADREDEQQRRDAQRWRDENGCDTQFCTWADPSVSVNDPEGPATLHAGIAGDHTLTEGAHDDEGHDGSEFGNHDSHGGAVYADVCAGTDAGTSHEGQAGACTGPQDTQVGITVVDHLDCPAGCADEYHVVRPLDPAYTEEQASDSQRDLAAVAADPQRWACGYEEQGSACYR